MRVTATTVLVVGGGPAGTVAAIVLAAAGVPVLLVDAGRHPLTPDTTVLSPAALAELETLLGTRRVPGLPLTRSRYLIGGRPSIDMSLGSGGLVVDRAQLRETLLARAGEVGADVITATIRSLRAVSGDGGVVAHDTGESLHVTADHAIVATGRSPSDLGLDGADPGLPGVAISARTARPGNGDAFDVHLPITDLRGASLVPAYGWTHPDLDGGTRIGIGAVGVEAARLAPRIFDGFVARVLEPELAGEPVARVSGPLRHGFTPDLAAAGPVLYAGDTAGLVNPFTGEGVSYALESGRLAAEAVLAARPDPTAVAAHYRRALAKRYVGQFETARHAVRRYHLVWRTLEATADDETPFFAKARRSVLAPSSLSAGRPPRRHFPEPALLACDEILLSSIRREWPFLARMITVYGSVLGDPIRPARLFLCAARTGTRPVDAAPIAAAIELGVLAGIAGLSVHADPPVHANPIDWGNTIAILASDFLLARGAALVSTVSTDLSWSFADWMEELVVVRGKPFDPTEPYAYYAHVFEFPCRICGQFAGATDDVVGSLRTLGASIGRLFGCREDARALLGLPTALEGTPAFMARKGLSAIPSWRQAVTSTPGTDLMAIAEQAHGRAMDDALTVIDSLPASSGKDDFRRIALGMTIADDSC